MGWLKRGLSGAAVRPGSPMECLGLVGGEQKEKQNGTKQRLSKSSTWKCMDGSLLFCAVGLDALAVLLAFLVRVAAEGCVSV